MNKEGLTTIVHRDRHGTVRNTREISVPLTSELGDSETLAMSQKGVTENLASINAAIGEMEQAIESGGADVTVEIENLQSQINAIVADKATVSLSASPSVVFIGEQVNISLTASCSPAASAITIRKGSTVLQSSTESRTSLTAADNGITPSANIAYTAEFVVAGITKTASRTVSAVHPIYVGAGATAEAATTRQAAKTSPAGTYSIPVATAGSYVWILVPGTMTISKATKNGFDFPLEDPTTTTRNGVAYKAYRSSNTYDAGTETIVIS